MQVPTKVLVYQSGWWNTLCNMRDSSSEISQKSYPYRRTSSGRLEYQKQGVQFQYSSGERAAVRCFGSDEMQEGVAIMEMEQVDVSISGNGTSMMKFAHPVGGTYKRFCYEHNKTYFAVGSGGGIGRTLNVDDLQAGPSSYGFTDMIARMYADTVFAGSSSVPAHVEMMGYIGMGNNPMVGATVSISVAVSEYLKKKNSVL